MALCVWEAPVGSMYDHVLNLHHSESTSEDIVELKYTVLGC